MDGIDDVGAKPSGLIYEEETYAIVGAAMDVYYRLGSGFLEPIYQEALGLEFELRGVPFQQQRELQVEYKGRLLKKTYFVDFLCFEKIIVEIKAIGQLSQIEMSQVINYLKVSKLRVGLLFNFGSQGHLEKKRIVV